MQTLESLGVVRRPRPRPAGFLGTANKTPADERVAWTADESAARESRQAKSRRRAMASRMVNGYETADIPPARVKRRRRDDDRLRQTLGDIQAMARDLNRAGVTAADMTGPQRRALAEAAAALGWSRC